MDGPQSFRGTVKLRKVASLQRCNIGVYLHKKEYKICTFMKEFVLRMLNSYLRGLHFFSNRWAVYNKSSATVFLGYLRGTWMYLMFFLISAVDFYYVIDKLIILVTNPH
jgi:hypothetical protein